MPAASPIKYAPSFPVQVPAGPLFKNTKQLSLLIGFPKEKPLFLIFYFSILNFSLLFAVGNAPPTIKQSSFDIVQQYESVIVLSKIQE